MRATKKHRLHQRFQIPAKAAEERLKRSGFTVVQKTPSNLILYGPKKAKPRAPLTHFARIALSHHYQYLHLTALFREDKELRAPWLYKLRPPILTILGLCFLALAVIVPSQAMQGFAACLFVLILAKTILTPRPSYVKDANLELERLLNQIMNQPEVTRRHSHRAIQISSKPSLRCAYCHDDLICHAPYTCSNCQTQIHWECLEELENCPTLGCQNDSGTWSEERQAAR